jgi:hypothetical protein
MDDIMNLLLAYGLISSIAVIVLIYAILLRAERDEAREQRNLYYHQLCRKYGYSGVVDGRNR